MESDDKILSAIFSQSKKDGDEKDKSADIDDADFQSESLLFESEGEKEENADGIEVTYDVDEMNDSGEDVMQNVVVAHPELFSKKDTDEICGGFVLKEGFITALPIEPDDIFNVTDNNGETTEMEHWLLFLHDSEGNAIWALDYYKAIRALKNLAVYGKKFIICERDGYILTTPLTYDELSEIEGEVTRLWEEDAQTVDTGWCPNPAKADGRMMYWSEYYPYFIMLWLLILVIRCPSMYDYGGILSVVKSAVYSVLFAGAGFGAGLLFLLASSLFFVFDTEKRKVCVYFAHFALVGFVFRAITDIYFINALNGFLGGGLVARSSIYLGLTLASIVFFRKKL